MMIGSWRRCFVDDVGKIDIIVGMRSMRIGRRHPGWFRIDLDTEDDEGAQDHADLGRCFAMLDFGDPSLGGADLCGELLLR
jgi:hypothetical protein